MNKTIIRFQKIRKRRAVSQIIGSLFALAIVAALGSILVIQGNQGIMNFTSYLDIFENFQTNPAKEILIIEHVRLAPDSEQVEIWVRNVGKIDAIIDRITMVKVDTQELIINSEDITICTNIVDTPQEPNCTPTDEANVFQEETRRIIFCEDSSCSDVNMPALPSNPVCSDVDEWKCQANSDPLKNEYEFRLTITTARDSTFETVVRLFNS